MNVFLNEMSRRYPENHLVVVLDGAACHRSRSLNIPENMTLIPLPPYSPELNPQENVWKEMKAGGFYNTNFLK
jgi:transposase